MWKILFLMVYGSLNYLIYLDKNCFSWNSGLGEPVNICTTNISKGKIIQGKFAFV